MSLSWVRGALALSFALVAGCSTQGSDVSPWLDGGGEEGTTPTDPREDGWRACLLDRPVCVEAVYCDDATVDDDPRCAGQALNACVVRPVARGAQCFDGELGHCDGRGSCR